MEIMNSSCFEIEDLGIQEHWVYDIEVEKNHNFFANDILVHNSVYVNVQNFVDMKPELTDDEDIEKYLNNICERLLEPKIKEIYEGMFEYMSFFENTMHMKREVIAKGAFWTGAKNYAMLVFNDEGKRYDPPKMKIMGIKVVRSDTPNAVKGMLKQFIEKVLFSAPIKEFVDDCKKTILNFDSSKLNKPSGVNVLNDYFIEGQTDPREATKKGAPFPVKGAINHNYLLEKLGMTDKIKKIENGERVFSLYLKPTNQYSFEEISFADKLPSEFGLEEYIDKTKMYEVVAGKFFNDVLTSIGRDSELLGYQNFELF